MDILHFKSKKEAAKKFYDYAANGIKSLEKWSEETRVDSFKFLKKYSESGLYPYWKDWLVEPNPQPIPIPFDLFFGLGKYVGQRKIDDLFVSIVKLMPDPDVQMGFINSLLNNFFEVYRSLAVLKGICDSEYFLEFMGNYLGGIYKIEYSEAENKLYCGFSEKWIADKPVFIIKNR